MNSGKDMFAMAMVMFFCGLIIGAMMGHQIKGSGMAKKIESGGQFIVGDATHKCEITNQLKEDYSVSK